MSDQARPGGFWQLLRAELLRMRSRRLFRWVAVLTLGLLLLTYVTVVLPALDRFARFSGQFTQIDPSSGFSVATPVPSIVISAIRAAFLPPLLGMGLIVGASHVGAEWASRGVTNLLFWEPRRARVLSAKFLAVGGTLFVATLVVLGLLLLSVSTGGTRGALLDSGSLLLFALRVAGLVAVTSIIAATIAAVARSTTAAAGVSFLLLAIVEPLLYANIDGYERIGISISAARFVEWSALNGQTDPLVAMGILVAYATAFMGIAISVFKQQEMG